MLLLLDWSRIFDRHAKIDILDLLGEDDTMEVSVVFVSRAVLGFTSSCTLQLINLGKYYLLDEFANETPSSQHVEDLTQLLQTALTSCLRERRIRAERLNDALWHLVRRKEEGEGADVDYDSEDEYDSDDDEFYHVEEGTPDAHGLPSSVSDGTREEWGAEAESDLHRMIYLRNSHDWDLPDLVPALVDWNKGFPLSFTPEFERHLSQTLQTDVDEPGSPNGRR